MRRKTLYLFSVVLILNIVCIGAAQEVDPNLLGWWKLDGGEAAITVGEVIGLDDGLVGLSHQYHSFLCTAAPKQRLILFQRHEKIDRNLSEKNESQRRSAFWKGERKWGTAKSVIVYLTPRPPLQIRRGGDKRQSSPLSACGEGI